MFMLCTFLVFYFCAASHGVIENDNMVQFGRMQLCMVTVLIGF